VTVHLAEIPEVGPVSVNMPANGANPGKVEAIRRALFDEPLGLGDASRPREELPGGAGLLHRGQAAVMFSERGAGKSTVATLLAVSAAASGERIFYWDRENGRQLTGERVESILEAHEDWPDVRERAGGQFIYREYPRLDPTWTPDAYGEALEGCALVIYDSLREAVHQLGGDPNKDEAISGFVALCISPVVKRGGSVLVLDNVGHEATHRPKGSGSKLDAIPQAFHVTTSEPFSAVQLGLISITCSRSRFGDFDRVWTMAVGGGEWQLPSTRSEDPAHRAAREVSVARSTFTRIVTSALREESPQGAKALIERARAEGLKRRSAALKIWLRELAEDPDSGVVHTPEGYVLRGPDWGVPMGGPMGGPEP
jgi:AAA domain-containing protein